MAIYFCQQINPPKEVGFDKLWNRLDLTEGKLVNATDEVTARMKVFRTSVLRRLLNVSQSVDKLHR